MSRLIMAVCVIAGLGGCTGQAASSCAPGYGSPVAVFTLFFGKAIPGRGDLTNDEWTSFLDNTVTANLPNGYSLFDAHGAWMNPVTHETIKEATKALLVALPEAPQSLAAINRIRNVYQLRFRQQRVGMIIEHACGSF